MHDNMGVSLNNYIECKKLKASNPKRKHRYNSTHMQPQKNKLSYKEGVCISDLLEIEVG